MKLADHAGVLRADDTAAVGHGGGWTPVAAEGGAALVALEKIELGGVSVGEIVAHAELDADGTVVGAEAGNEGTRALTAFGVGDPDLIQGRGVGIDLRLGQRIRVRRIDQSGILGDPVAFIPPAPADHVRLSGHQVDLHGIGRGGTQGEDRTEGDKRDG